MQAHEDNGGRFYSYLRHAYEALAAGDNAEAERSLTAAANIDPYALAAVEWWTLLRAEAALTGAELENEPAAVNPRAARVDWRTSLAAVRQAARGLLHVPVLTHAVAGIGACVTLIAFMMYRPSLHSRNVADRKSVV